MNRRTKGTLLVAVTLFTLVAYVVVPIGIQWRNLVGFEVEILKPALNRPDLIIKIRNRGIWTLSLSDLDWVTAMNGQRLSRLPIPTSVTLQPMQTVEMSVDLLGDGAYIEIHQIDLGVKGEITLFGIKQLAQPFELSTTAYLRW